MEEYGSEKKERREKREERERKDGGGGDDDDEIKGELGTIPNLSRLTQSLSTS